MVLSLQVNKLDWSLQSYIDLQEVQWCFMAERSVKKECDKLLETHMPNRKIL